MIPFRRKAEVEYAVFKRLDMGVWQFIAGGVEAGETVLSGAVRETFEETAIPRSSKFYKLDTFFTVTIDYFPELQKIWKSKLYVVPVHCFAVDCDKFEMSISHEHSEYRWGNFQKCRELLYFSNDKNALWELDQRIKDKTLKII